MIIYLIIILEVIIHIIYSRNIYRNKLIIRTLLPALRGQLYKIHSFKSTTENFNNYESFSLEMCTVIKLYEHQFHPYI